MKFFYTRLIIFFCCIYVFFVSSGCASTKEHTEKWRKMKTDCFTINLPKNWVIDSSHPKGIYDYSYVVKYENRKIFEINIIINGGSEDFLVPLKKWEHTKLKDTDYYYLSFKLHGHKGIAFKSRTDFRDSNNTEINIFIKYTKENINLKNTINTVIRSLRATRTSLCSKPKIQEEIAEP